MTEWFLESESGWASNTNSRRNRFSSGTARVWGCSFIFHPRLLKGSFVWSLIQMSFWIWRIKKKGLFFALCSHLCLCFVLKAMLCWTLCVSGKEQKPHGLRGAEPQHLAGCVRARLHRYGTVCGCSRWRATRLQWWPFKHLLRWGMKRAQAGRQWWRAAHCENLATVTLPG